MPDYVQEKKSDVKDAISIFHRRFLDSGHAKIVKVKLIEVNPRNR